MDSRTRLLITAAVLCHPLLVPRLVTSQLLPTNDQRPTFHPGAYKPSEPITITAERQECAGRICKLSGNAAIDYGLYRLSGDEITYNADTGEADGEGHLVLAGGPNDEHIEATRGTYNLRSEVGRFEHVRGSIGLTRSQRPSLFIASAPFSFSGRMVEKTGPDHYVVIHGTITTCELPHPKWQFYFHRVEVEAGGNATIYHTNFRLEGIPILYLPFATHPVEKQARKSGFLIPNIGRSSTRGYTIGESFFWTMNRSMDLHAGAEYFSRRGWAPDGEFRARPTETSFLDLTFFSVFDRGISGVNQGGTEVHLDSEEAFRHHFRGLANIDYLSSYVFRLAFSDVFAQAVNSEVKSEAFLSNTTGSVFLNATTRRYQDFQSTTPGDVITILHAPGFEVSSVEQRLGPLPLSGRFEASAEGLSRSEPSFSTAPLVGRFDFNPVLSAPLLFRDWSFRPSLSLRDTIYTQQLVPSAGIALTDVGAAISKTLNRKSLQGSLELRPPALEKVWSRQYFGRRWKHVVEPRVVYTYVTGVENFPHILRFDERDILSDDNEVEYAVVNRFYAKRLVRKTRECEQEGMPALLVGAPAPPSRLPWGHREFTPEQACSEQPETREVVTWELAQKYFIDPTFGGALVPGRRNVFTSTVDLTGIAFLTTPRHLSPLVSRLRISTTARNELEWDMDYDFLGGRVNTSTLLFNHYFGPFTVGAGNAFLHVPGQISATNGLATDEKFNQYRAVLGYGSPGKRGFSGAFNLGLDARADQVQYGSGQLAYNWDCCGINVEYRRFALATVRNENQFRFTFALANVGAFGNLRRGERLF